MSVAARQLFFLLVIACAVSFGAEGRVVPWLVLDAGVSAAFIPIIQILGFGLAWRVRLRSTRGRSRDLEGFLDGNAPWLWWWSAVAAVAAFVPPRPLGRWVTTLALSAVVPLVWSIARDFRWCRERQARTARQSLIDVAVLRLLTWAPGLAWFFGIAIWYGEVPKLVAWWRA